jgi:hypothetical protein
MDLRKWRGFAMQVSSAGIVVLSIGGLAYAQYVDPARSTTGKDLTQIHSGLFSSSKAPFEYQTLGSWSIGYSLVKETFGGDYLRLTLVFKNVGTTPSSIAPIVTMNDGGGILMTAQSYNDMYGRATLLANSPTVSVPPPTQHTLSTTTTTQGTVTDQNGQVSNFTAQSTTPGPLVNVAAQIQESIARQQAQAANSNSEMNRLIGNEYLQWLPRSWLKDHYDIPVGTAAVGALLFARHGKESLPLVVNVQLGDQQFTFRSHYN